MNLSLFIIIVFLALSLYLGIRSRKGKEMNLEQWAIGGRGLGTIFVFLLLAGENFTTYTFLGVSGSTYSLGAPMIYAFTPICYIVGYWLLPPVWKYAKEKQLLTQSDFFASKYNSKPFGFFVALVGVISVIPYLVLQLKGLGIIVSEASYGAVSPSAAIWIGMLTATVYVTISGIHGSAWTSVIKDILMFIIIIFIAIYLPFHYYGGIKPMFQTVGTVKPEMLTLPDSGNSISWYVSSCILFALGAYMWPHMFGASLSAKSAKVLKRNNILTPIYQLVMVLVLFIGFTAVLQVPGLKGAEVDRALFELVKRTFDPWFVGVIGGAGLLTALVPTSMLLMTAATLMSKNIYQTLKPQTSDQQLSRLTRILVPILALVSLYLTFKGGNTIVALLLMAYGFVVQLFPAVFFSLLKRNPVTVQGAFAGTFIGVAIVAYVTVSGTTISTLFPQLPQFIKDMDIGIIAVVLNIVFMLFISLITRKMNAVPRLKNETRLDA
ncbi:SSS family solute:Na+ symporter [Scopulibacillus darangshiensis]|uniref:SSS family solute:Na+ symporter n=1 Tax=Scopulibacillus darangshiensis TaxID=442528 RepID=A0A4R2NI44_9BACL|nr:sodium:solute symporter [Scopulibacillus darangshiensis]TCP21061.1 SSS family solute:Na+ symporter [Scopulibacillus darangshiensis]